MQVSEIIRNQSVKGDAMRATIERLRASKGAHLMGVFDEAVQAGKVWAKDDAEYGQLKKLAAAVGDIDLHKDSEVSIAHIFGLDHSDERDFWESVFVDEKPAALEDDYEAFQAGFAFGALKVWEQVADQI